MCYIRITEFTLLLVALIYILAAPFTKVEESFNIQAIHDILFYGGDVSQYDHNYFPGVVPRTFIGPLAISSYLYPIFIAFKYFHFPKYWLQYGARITLGSMSLTSFFFFGRCVEQRFGRRVGTFLRIITMSQFHFIFYSSRTLPNTFSMIFVLLIYRMYLNDRKTLWPVLATFTSFIFRIELILLFAPIFIADLIISSNRSNAILNSIISGFLTLLLSLVVTIPIDSYFWNRWLWPEGEVAWFNIWLNRSAEYGVQPFFWYFTSALPRALLFSFFLVPLGWIVNRKNMSLVLFPALTFVFSYSFLPHKELRFILYAVPLMNLSAATFCSWAWNNRSFLQKWLAIGIVLHFAFNFFCSIILLYASSNNYPGGEALFRLQVQQKHLNKEFVNVHIDEFCAQSGVTRFIQLYDTWEYNKTEGLTPEELEHFDYLLIGNLDEQNQLIQELLNSHKEYFSVTGFHRITYFSLHLSENLNFVTKLLPSWIHRYAKIPLLDFKTKAIVMKRKNY